MKCKRQRPLCKRQVKSEFTAVMSHPKNILVIKLSAFGDFILALGPMAAIRKQHPDAKITLLTTRTFVDLAQKSGYVDKVLVTQRHKIHQIGKWAKLLMMLRKHNFDRVYDLQMNGRTKKYCRMMSLFRKLDWSGVVSGSPLFYDNPNWRDMHAFDRHKEVLKIAGIKNLTIPDMTWLETDIDLFKLKKPFILCVPGSAPTRPDKRWPAIRYAGLARKLSHEGYQVVLLGTQAEAEVTKAIKRGASDVVDLTGKTSIFDIAGMARQAAGAVGNDTGPIHLIAAAGCPTLTLFSSASDPEHSAPRGKKVIVLQSDDLADLKVSDVKDALSLRE